MRLVKFIIYNCFYKGKRRKRVKEKNAIGELKKLVTGYRKESVMESKRS